MPSGQVGCTGHQSNAILTFNAFRSMSSSEQLTLGAKLCAMFSMCGPTTGGGRRRRRRRRTERRPLTLFRRTVLLWAVRRRIRPPLSTRYVATAYAAVHRVVTDEPTLSPPVLLGIRRPTTCRRRLGRDRWRCRERRGPDERTTKRNLDDRTGTANAYTRLGDSAGRLRWLESAT